MNLALWAQLVELPVVQDLGHAVEARAAVAHGQFGRGKRLAVLQRPFCVVIVPAGAQLHVAEGVLFDDHLVFSAPLERGEEHVALRVGGFAVRVERGERGVLVRRAGAAVALEHDLLLMEHMPLRLIFRAPVARVVRQAVIIARGQLHAAAAEDRQLDGRAGAVGHLNPALDEIELPHGAITQDGSEIIVFVL